MKFTQYFLSARERPDRAVIELQWIETVVKSPFREEVQRDGRIRRWAYIAEVEKYLRVFCWKMGKRYTMRFLIDPLKHKRYGN